MKTFTGNSRHTKLTLKVFLNDTNAEKNCSERVLVFSFSATVLTLIYSSQSLETLAFLNKSPNSIFLYAGFK